MGNFNIVVFDLGGVIINLNVPRCVGHFKRLMGEENASGRIAVASFSSVLVILIKSEFRLNLDLVIVLVD